MPRSLIECLSGLCLFTRAKNIEVDVLKEGQMGQDVSDFDRGQVLVAR